MSLLDPTTHGCSAATRPERVDSNKQYDIVLAIRCTSLLQEKKLTRPSIPMTPQTV